MTKWLNTTWFSSHQKQLRRGALLIPCGGAKTQTENMACSTFQLFLNLATNSLESRHRGLSKLNHVKTAWLHQCLANPLPWIKVRQETLLSDVTRAEAKGENMTGGSPGDFRRVIGANLIGQLSVPLLQIDYPCMLQSWRHNVGGGGERRWSEGGVVALTPQTLPNGWTMGKHREKKIVEMRKHQACTLN